MSGHAMRLQQMLPYIYKDPSYLEKSLTAGDTESEDREGQRGLSQVGDALMRFMILCEGFRHGLSRKEQQESLSALSSKDECAKLGRRLSIDKLIKCSPRQGRAGPQPVTVKNTLSAIVATAYYDSGSMDTVLQVMASLGIVNRAQHCVRPQDLTLATPSTPDSNIDELIDFGAEGASDGVDPEDWTFLFESTQSEANGLEFINNQSSPELLAAAPGMNDKERLVAGHEYSTQQLGDFSVELPLASLTPTTLNGEIQGRSDGIPFKHTADFTTVAESQHRADHFSPTSERLQYTEPPANRTKRSLDVSSLNEPHRRGKAPRSYERNENRKRYKEIIMNGVKNRCMMYFEAELGKGAREREELDAYLLDYSVAICSLEASNPDMLLGVALGIGSCTAMLTLQQAVESVRSGNVAEAIRVSCRRSPEERLAAIRYLELRMAHFRLARRLHIYHLFLEAQAECAQVESDGFVFVTPSPQHTSKGPTKCGNARNGRKAQVTNAMISQGCTHLTRQKTVSQQRESVTKLRRFGERLKKLKDKFTIGVFALLDDALDENIIRGAGDKAFDDFVALIDRFDGKMIRSLSSAACLITEFVNNGEDQHVSFKIETVTAEHIGRLARGSVGMEELLRPL